MRRRKQQIGAVVAGAVVLASGAYAIGSQSGGGSATAAKSSSSSQSGVAERHPDGPFGPNLDALATALGVKTADLRTALDQIRAAHKPPNGDPRNGFIKDFAAAIGLPEAKVKAAFDSVGPPKGARRMHVRLRHGFRHGRMGGPPPGGPMGGPPPRGPGAPGGPPDGGPDGRHAGPPADVVSKLAKALGVKDSDVTAAFAKLRTQHDAQESARRDQFAQELASKLGLDVSKVKSALDSVRPEHARRGGP